MDKAQQESLIKKFDVDLDPKTNAEYRNGSKKSFYLEKIELQDDYDGSQEECDSLNLTIKDLRGFNENQMNQIDNLQKTHTSDIKSLEEELAKVRSQSDKVATSVRKIPLLGTDTLSYQSDFILRWKEHLKEWNDLVSDFQNKYLPVLKEAINSFITRVKNVEI